MIEMGKVKEGGEGREDGDGFGSGVVVGNSSRMILSGIF